MAKTDVTTADYIIVGGGSAGCVLARRLSDGLNARVLLVEDGGSGKGLLTDMPAALGMAQDYPAYNWAYTSVPQPKLGGRRIAFPRGRGLGGSSLINGTIYIRGHPGDFDRWAESGLTGWSHSDVLPYFLKSADAPQHVGSPHHGRNGMIRTSPAPNFNALDEMFIEAAVQAGADRLEDINGAKHVGVGRLDVTVRNGVRQSAARSYLAKPNANLGIMTGTRAHRVITDGHRAIGVETSRGPIMARREVILSLGAFETPKLLMLSGIGPGAHLKHMGVEVLRDLPGVGKGLADHPNVPIRFDLLDRNLSFARYQRPWRAALIGLQWLALKTGPATAPFWSTALFHALDGGDMADVEVFFMSFYLEQAPATRREAGLSWIESRTARLLSQGKIARPGIQFDINLLRPESVGQVTLASPDPEAPPSIDCAYLSAEADERVFIDSIRHMRRVAAQPAMRGRAGEELAPGADVLSDDDLLDYVRAHVITGHHPACTAHMGADTDPLAVLDGRFRLRGMQGLRVVDASAMPDMISGNIHATVIMMAERAADMIITEAGRSPVFAAESVSPST